MTEYENGRVSLQVLSHTRTSVERDCAAKYGYRYADGLRPKVEKDSTRIRGRGMHEGFEAGYRKWRFLKLALLPALDEIEVLELIRTAALEACQKAHEVVLVELGAARENGAPIEQYDEALERLVEAHDADMWALGHFFDVVVPRDYARKIPVLIEHEFNVPILDVRGAARHLRWYGFLDCVMYDERMRILELHEQKTVGTNTGSDEHRRRIEGDPQTTSYIYALRSLQASGELDAVLLASGLLESQARTVPIGSVVVNVIRRKRPSEPKLLADGTISIDRRIDTLPEVYAAALERQVEPPEIAVASEAVAETELGVKAARDAFASVQAQVEPPEFAAESEAVTEADVELVAAREALAAAEEPTKTLERYVVRFEKKKAKAIETLSKKRATWQATRAKQMEVLERDIERAQKRFAKALEALGKKRASWQGTLAKQAELLDALRRRGDTFIAEIEHFVSDRECKRWRGEQWIGAERMRRIEKRPAERTRNLGFCTSPGRGCTYRTLCYSGGDEQIRSQEFTTPDEREIIAEEAERLAEEKAAEEADYDPELEGYGTDYSASAWG